MTGYRRTHSSPFKDALGVAALAVAAFFIVAGGARLYGAVGMLDPWIYTSYIHNYGDLLARFGRTYYSTRVAAIWPQSWLYDWIGEAAYAVSRWGVLLGIGVGFAAFLRQRAGRWGAYSAGIALMFSAPLLLELADDYTQEWALAYASVALPCLAARRWQWVLLGGVFVSLAVNAHENAVFVVLPMLLVLAVASLAQESIRTTLARVWCFIAGFVVLQVILSVSMGIAYGWERSNYFFQEMSFQMSSSLVSGVAANWQVPWDNLYSRITTSMILVGAWLLGAWLVLRIRTAMPRGAFLVGALAMTTLVGMILVAHFVFHAGFVGWSFTLVFAIFFATASAWFGLASTGAPGRAIPLAGLGTAIFIGFLLPSWLPYGIVWELLWWIAIAIAFGALVLAAASRREHLARYALAVGAVAIVGGIIPLGPLTRRDSARALYIVGNSGAVDEAPLGAIVRGHALQFLRYLNETVPLGTSFRTFFPFGIPEFNSIGSMELWMSSCAGCSVSPDVFPAFSPAAISDIQRVNAVKLVIVGPTRGQVRRAQVAAAKTPLKFTTTLPLTPLTTDGATVWVTTSTRRPIP